MSIKDIVKFNQRLLTIIMVIPWVFGIVLANGFWSTLFAFCIPFWAWYLTAEKWLMINGWVT